MLLVGSPKPWQRLEVAACLLPAFDPEYKKAKPEKSGRQAAAARRPGLAGGGAGLQEGGQAKAACASEPEAGAHTHPLEDRKAEIPVVTECHHGDAGDLDEAYAAIPEADREAWYERADRALESAGMPDWVRIAPTVKEMAVRLWVGSTIPALASG